MSGSVLGTPLAFIALVDLLLPFFPNLSWAVEAAPTAGLGQPNDFAIDTGTVPGHVVLWQKSGTGSWSALGQFQLSAYTGGGNPAQATSLDFSNSSNSGFIPTL